MAAPVRIQLRRMRGWRMPPNTIKVDRTTKWGNPFVPGRPSGVIPGRNVQDKRHAASLYLGFAPLSERLVADAPTELGGRNLACWCHLCELHAETGRRWDRPCPFCDPCHVDTLLRLANERSPTAIEQRGEG